MGPEPSTWRGHRNRIAAQNPKPCFPSPLPSLSLSFFPSMKAEAEAEAEAEEACRWRVSGGPYVGEISALCLLSSSSTPLLLLAGMGSQVLLYDLVRCGRLISSFQVFNGGIRVHGIRVPSSVDISLLDVNVCVLVFGETNLKLFLLSSTSTSTSAFNPRLDLVHRLAPFDQWVLDACFLQQEEPEQELLVAVGLSDNSVALWDVASRSLVARVHSPHSCLLYSMRFWGHTIPTLRLASGTIFNDILVWKLEPHDFAPLHLARLSAHHGSIFSLSWSPDGSKLISASDDRRTVLASGTSLLQLKMHNFRHSHNLLYLAIMLEFGTATSLIL